MAAYRAVTAVGGRLDALLEALLEEMEKAAIFTSILTRRTRGTTSPPAARPIARPRRWLISCGEESKVAPWSRSYLSRHQCCVEQNAKRAPSSTSAIAGSSPSAQSREALAPSRWCRRGR